MNFLFWPPRLQHVIQTVDLPAPLLDPAVIELIRKILVSVDALRTIQACNDLDLQIIYGLKKSVSLHLSAISDLLQDGDSRQAIIFTIEGLLGIIQFAEATQSQAGLNELSWYVT